MRECVRIELVDRARVLAMEDLRRRQGDAFVHHRLERCVVDVGAGAETHGEDGRVGETVVGNRAHRRAVGEQAVGEHREVATLVGRDMPERRLHERVPHVVQRVGERR